MKSVVGEGPHAHGRVILTPPVGQKFNAAKLGRAAPQTRAHSFSDLQRDPNGVMLLLDVPEVKILRPGNDSDRRGPQGRRTGLLPTGENEAWYSSVD